MKDELAMMEAEAYPDPVAVENERELPQPSSYVVQMRGVATPLAIRCQGNEEARRRGHQS